MADLDIVGGAAVDVVPIVPNFHNRLKGLVLPIADRVGEEAGRRMGEAISRNIVVAIPDAVTNGGQHARVSATRQGTQIGGAFGESIKRKLEVAFRSLPRANVRLGDTGLNADLDRLRARIQSLAGKTVGIDLDAGAALAEIADINARLERLNAQHPSVQVRTDTAAAMAALAEVQRQINDVDRDDVNIRVKADTSGAMAALRGLGIAVAAVGAIPVIPVAAAGIGAITSAAVAAGAGIGALAIAAVPAIKSVTEVIQQKTAAEKQSKTATDNSAASSVKAAQQALTLANAQASLASAHRQAAQTVAQANRQVEDAERSLADAQRGARQAELDLTQARSDAAQTLKDLNDQLLDGMLDQREATLRVNEARADLAKTVADPTSTELERQRAQLTYDEAVRNADKQKTKNAELKKSVDDANKAGVNGSKQVRDAQEQVRQANEKVADQERTLADDRAKVRDAQVQGAEAIASAERGLESARLSGIDTAVKSTTATDDYRKALAKLSPEQRQLYDSIAGPKGLKRAFTDWAASMAPAVLPLFTRGVDGAKTALPGLSTLVTESADAVGILYDKASKSLKSPFWQGFKDDIDKSANPAIVGLGTTFGNVLTGMAGIVDAFLPHIDGIADRMVKASGRFANWGKGLKGSPAFEKMLTYAAEHGPKLSELLGAIVDAAFQIGEALSPVSGPVIDFLTGVANTLGFIADKAPWAVIGLWGIYAATKAIQLAAPLWAAAMTIYTFATATAAAGTWTWAAALQATGIVPLIEAIVLVIAALVVGVIWAYKNVGWFRTAVDTSWHFIRDVTVWLWEKALKPAFEGIWTLLKLVGDVAVWLWQKVLSPAFDAIGLAARILFAIVVTAVLAPMWIAFQALGLISVWLWEKAIKPSLGFIGQAVTWLWNNQLQPFLQGFWDGIQWVGDKFKWLYDHMIKPVSEWIANKVKALWDNWLSPAFLSIWDGIQWLGGKFKWLYDKGVKPIVDDITSAFHSMAKGIKSAWDDVVDQAKTPVNFIIHAVYEKGIKAVWDKVAKFVGLDALPAAPKLLEAGGTVGNGWGPAAPMKVSRPTAIVGEGNPNYPEYIIPTDPKYRSRALAMHQAAGTQLLESGGVLGGVWDWTKDTVGDVVGKGIDWAKTGASLLADPSSVWKKLTTPILNKVSDGVGTSPMGKALTKIPTKMVAGLKDKIVTAAESLFSSGGGGGGQWIKPVNVPYGTKFGVAGPMWSSGHHTGLDFPAPTGTPVHAVADGDVTGAASGGPYGNHVIISHGGGLASLYAHMSKILTAVGKHVTQGQQIGRVGATGNVTGPHLHLEARVNGRAVDPMSYLTGGKGFGAVAAGTAQRYAKGILGQYGWGPDQFGPLKALWQGESGWNYRAKNPSSGAYGIPQALPASKMASAGSDWLTNYATQIRWGLGYIKGRSDYGSPAAAYSKWLSRSPHWYDNGGMLPTGLSLVANGTGSPEPVFTGSQWSDIRAAKSGGGTHNINVVTHTYLDGREVGGIIDQKIEAHDADTGRALYTGRYV
ncbi:peptidoglycan DD-metalloendopeptidase family protein [Streptomyces sp. NPDC059272]|uniref:aggregation-promoting factor C-terminal-like domain-containing protein n=1 Tax=Streptomyces sp. NPDC059272 TaxID=3346800 RepID=UPI0036C59F6F